MALHKEVIERKQYSIILIFLAMLMTFIIVSDLLDVMVPKTYLFKIIKYLSYLIMICIALFQIKRLRTKYKYSLIQDELIIHKITGESENLLEIVNLADIQYIGRSDKITDKLNFHGVKRYDFCKLRTKNYICVYKLEGRLKKFYFNPSDRLIRNIERCSNTYREFNF